MTIVTTPAPYFTDASGAPLDEGYIYIGTDGLDARTNPITVYFDAALTIPAVQPIRTSGGYPVYQGAAKALFVNANACSMTVLDKFQRTNFNELSIDLPSLASDVPTLSALAASGGSALVGFIQAGTSPLARTAQAKMREVLSLSDFAVGDGTTDDTTAVANAIAQALSAANVLDGAGKTYRLTSKVNISSNLKMRNATFKIDHTGVGFGQATAGGGGNEIARCYFENIKLLAAQNATIGWDCVTFQYCQWVNCFVGSTGGTKFARAWKFSNVAYWNTFYSPEVEQVTTYGWDLSDANDTRFYMPRHVDFSGTPSAAIYMSGGCSGVSVFGPSFEAKWADAPIQLHASSTNNQVYGGRCELRATGVAGQAIKYNSASQNQVMGLYALGFGAASDTVGNNQSIISTGTAASAVFGAGQMFVSTNTVNADTVGGVIYNTSRSQFTGYDGSARDFVMSPASQNQNMNGNYITSVASLRLQDGVSDPGTGAGLAIIFVDSADGDLKVRFGDGTLKTIVTDT